MARRIDDDIHCLADQLIGQRYTAEADERQRAMGLSYVTAEREDLVREVAAFARRMIDLMKEPA